MDLFTSLRCFARQFARVRRTPRPEGGCKLRPRLLALEDRSLPTAGFSVFGNVLTVTGDGGRDYIEIQHYGRGNTVRIRPNFDSAWAPIGSSISEIRINTNGGRDNVFFWLMDDLSESIKVTADLGPGDDKFRANLHDDLVGSNLSAGSHLRLIAEGGDGIDTLLVDATLRANVGRSGSLLVDYAGEDGTDEITVAYTGELDGNFYLRADGNANKDRVGAHLTFAGGSTGQLAGTADGWGRLDLPARVRGGDGDDTLTFSVRNHGTAGVFARIQGGGGFDSGKRTTNVVAEEIDVDVVVV